MTRQKRKRQRGQAAKAAARARKLRDAAGFRRAYEQALFDKGRALAAELGVGPDLAAFFADGFAAAHKDLETLENPDE